MRVTAVMCVQCVTAIMCLTAVMCVQCVTAIMRVTTVMCVQCVTAIMRVTDLRRICETLQDIRNIFTDSGVFKCL
jgi:hypothetical protein